MSTLNLTDIRASMKNAARDQYLRDHAPRLLAALIMRRHSTDPERLIEAAVNATASLYDSLYSMSPRFDPIEESEPPESLTVAEG